MEAFVSLLNVVEMRTPSLSLVPLPAGKGTLGKATGSD